MEIFAKQIGTDFVTLEFSNMRVPGTDFKDVSTSKTWGEETSWKTQ